MSSFDNDANTKEILKMSENQNVKKPISQSHNPNQELNNNTDNNNSENLNKSNSDEEVNISTYPLKISFLGNSSVGKTSIIQRFVENKFDSEKITSTISIAYSNKRFKTDPFTEINMQIWDTAGQERFRSLTSGYLRDSDGIFIVFDLGNKKSFEDLGSWLEEINNSDINKKNCVRMLIGNKLDLEKKEIDDITANKFAEENGMNYLEVSAKNGINIITMFEMMGSACVKLLLEEENFEGDNKIDIKKSHNSQKLKNTGEKDEIIQENKNNSFSKNERSKQEKKNNKCC